jgi:hypothetical protein
MLAAQKSALKRREEVTRYVMDDRIVYYIANLHIKTVALRECNVKLVLVIKKKKKKKK